MNINNKIKFKRSSLQTSKVICMHISKNLKRTHKKEDVKGP